MIEVEELTKEFADHQAVKGISFSATPGQIVGFLGPNGAGKTTTMRMLTGFLPPTSGRASKWARATSRRGRSCSTPRTRSH